jgi:hypothetical protein
MHLPLDIAESDATGVSTPYRYLSQQTHGAAADQLWTSCGDEGNPFLDALLDGASIEGDDVRILRIEQGAPIGSVRDHSSIGIAEQEGNEWFTLSETEVAATDIGMAIAELHQYPLQDHDQIDRGHAIGQTPGVIIPHLLLDGSIEIDPLEVQVGELIPECSSEGGDLFLDLFLREP